MTSKVPGEVRHGTRGGRPDVLAARRPGALIFDSPDTALPVLLLLLLVHVRRVERLLRHWRAPSSARKRANEARLTPGLYRPGGGAAHRSAEGDAEAEHASSWKRRADWQMRTPRVSDSEMHSELYVRWKSLPNSPRRRRCRARCFFDVSPARWAPRWNTCSPGGWPLPRNLSCRSSGTISGLPDVAERVGGMARPAPFSTAFSRHVGRPPKFARARGIATSHE